jgi:hypothetical protein
MVAHSYLVRGTIDLCFIWHVLLRNCADQHLANITEAFGGLCEDGVIRNENFYCSVANCPETTCQKIGNRNEHAAGIDARAPTRCVILVLPERGRYKAISCHSLCATRHWTSFVLVLFHCRTTKLHLFFFN